MVVNTCGFLEASRAESLDTIRRAVDLKSKGVARVIVAGCMVGNYRDILEREAPGVDRYLPFVDYAQLDKIADEVLPPRGRSSFMVERRRADISLSPAHFSWLKISEGCNHTCSFCVIPSIRGPMRSFPEDDLVRRAEHLVDKGVQEINLIAQDSTVYGTDLYGENRVVRLLERLDRIERLLWVRLMYAYPTEVTPAMMDLLAGGSRIVPYLDVPVQHASDAVLKRMRRGYGRKDLDRLVSGLRQRRPDFTLRTTVIVGFPGETDEEFGELLDFIRSARFRHLGAFAYSREPGSRADDLPGHLPDSVKQARLDEVVRLQQSIAFESRDRRLGESALVLVDAASADGEPARARSVMEAPEIDSHILIDGGPVNAGDLLQVRIRERRGYDLVATPMPRVESAV